MRYALTIMDGEEWESVNTLIIEDGLDACEVPEKSWRDGGEELVDILVACGYDREGAEIIVEKHYYYTINCEDIDYNTVLLDDMARLEKIHKQYLKEQGKTV